MYSLDDTIAAIASPPGGAARGIVRISGPHAAECVGRLFQANTAEAEPCSSVPRVVYGRLILSELHSPLPCDAYFWSNRSYTGQPVVEIHTLGSPPLLQLVLRAICSTGARLAAPGEFTLRAFLAGRIDLSQAEAVLGVIDAADSHDLKVALGQLAGGLARPLHRLRDDLLDLLAHLEAGFDFADEDLSFLSRAELDRRLVHAEQSVASILRQMNSRADAPSGTRVVLVGRPNTGKSSLFNTLAGAQAALVSGSPGTTRDYLVVDLDLDGVKCQLIDTAGTCVDLPEDFDPIDSAAQAAAAEQHRASHLRLFCLDSTSRLESWEREELDAHSDKQRIVVLTKCDAPRGIDWIGSAIQTSSLTGQGIESLRAELRRMILAAGGDRGEVVAATALRCSESLRLAGECLDRARRAAAAGQEELVAAELRVALDQLGTVVGAVYTEDVLDRIFSKFCVGK